MANEKIAREEMDREASKEGLRKTQTPADKPRAKLVGENGNVFNLMGICSRALKKAGQPEKAKEMCEKITKTAKSYGEALEIMSEYCEVE